MSPKGRVIGIDHIKGIVDLSIANVNKNRPDLIQSGRIKFIGLNICSWNLWQTYNFSSILAVGDGRKGFPEEAPYDAIHVGAAAPTLPQSVKLIKTNFTN